MRRWTHYVDRHLALFITGGTTLLFLGKVYLAADFEVSTALAIVGAAPTTTLLLGLAVALLPSVLTGLLGASGGYLVIRWAQRQSWRPWLASTVGLAVLVAATGAVMAVAFLIVWLALWTPELLSIRRRQAKSFWEAAPRMVRLPHLVIVSTAPILIVLFLLQTDPWPVERVKLSNGETLVGSILDVSSSYWPVLIADERRLRYVPSSDVEGRELCAARRSEWWELSIVEMVSPKPPMPLCDAAAEAGG